MYVDAKGKDARTEAQYAISFNKTVRLMALLDLANSLGMLKSFESESEFVVSFIFVFSLTFWLVHQSPHQRATSQLHLSPEIERASLQASTDSISISDSSMVKSEKSDEMPSQENMEDEEGEYYDSLTEALNTR